MLAGLSHNLTAPTGSVSVGSHTGFYFMDFPNPIASNASLDTPPTLPETPTNPSGMLAGLSHNLTAPTGSVSVGSHTGFYFMDFPNPIASNASLDTPPTLPETPTNPSGMLAGLSHNLTAPTGSVSVGWLWRDLSCKNTITFTKQAVD
jgi:hypothetical protein